MVLVVDDKNKYNMAVLKKAAIKNKQKSHEDIYYNNSNKKCLDIIDVLFQKIIEMMEKDITTNGTKKAIVVSATKRITPGIKEYVSKISKEDTNDIIKRIINIISEKDEG